MSKSTPLAHLNKNVPSAEEERESLLVNEILNEINKDEGQSGDNLNMEILTQELEEEPPQFMEEPVVQAPPVQAPAPAPAPAQVNPIPPKELEEELKEPNGMFLSSQEEEKTMVQDLLDRLKSPLIVGALVVLFSIPQVTEVLSKLVPPREILQKFKLPVVLLMKFLLSAIVFFAINMVM